MSGLGPEAQREEQHEDVGASTAAETVRKTLDDPHSATPQ